MRIDSVYDFLIDHVNILDHPQFVDWPPEKQLFHIGRELFTVLDQHYDALASADKSDDAQVQAAIQRFLDKYIAPLTKTGRPGVDLIASLLMTQLPARLTEVLAGVVQDRMGS